MLIYGEANEVVNLSTIVCFQKSRGFFFFLYLLFSMFDYWHFTDLARYSFRTDQCPLYSAAYIILQLKPRRFYESKRFLVCKPKS